MCSFPNPHLMLYVKTRLLQVRIFILVVGLGAVGKQAEVYL